MTYYVLIPRLALHGNILVRMANLGMAEIVYGKLSHFNDVVECTCTCIHNIIYQCFVLLLWVHG